MAGAADRRSRTLPRGNTVWDTNQQCLKQRFSDQRDSCDRIDKVSASLRIEKVARVPRSDAGMRPPETKDAERMP